MKTQQQWLEIIQQEIDKSPFKGIMKAEISRAGFVVLTSIVSDIRYDNKERAYPNSFSYLDDLCHQAWLDYKESKLNENN